MFGTDIPGIDLSNYFDKTTILGQVLEFLIYTAIAAIVTSIVLAIYKQKIKKKLKEKKNIQIRFTQNIIRTLIILIAIIWVLMSSTATTDIGKVLFQGTAIIGAVIGLAAQPVIESEYSEPEWKNKDYGPVYFIAYADSSLVLATTVYYKPTNATEMVMSDINKRVNDAFAREGIEIPYNYVNVVMKKDD